MNSLLRCLGWIRLNKYRMGKKALAKWQNPYRAWSPRAQSSDKLNYAKVQKFRFRRLKKSFVKKSFVCWKSFEAKKKKVFLLRRLWLKLTLKHFQTSAAVPGRARKQIQLKKMLLAKRSTVEVNKIKIWLFGNLAFGNLAPWQFGPLAIWLLGK